MDTWEEDLTDFTLSNARRFYLSTGGILGCLRCQWVNIINNYSPKANNCFSINTQVIISKKRKKKHFNAKSCSITVAKRLLTAILSVEVIIG